MILYLDTSSWLKLYLDEEHTETVRIWAEEAALLATSRIAYAEALAALGRRRRDRTLEFVVCDQLVDDITAAWADFLRIEVDEVAAGGLALRHDLRGADAIHVQAALTCRSAGVERADVAFTSFDRNQLAAAQAEGLRVLTPTA